MPDPFPSPTPAPSFPSPWPFHRTIPIIYHDIDALNHLNHAAYFRFMETLRCDYYLPLTGHSDPTRLDIIVAEAACRYLAPVVYGQELLGELAPARPLGRTSFTLLYRFGRRVPTTRPSTPEAGPSSSPSTTRSTGRRRSLPIFGVSSRKTRWTPLPKVGPSAGGGPHLHWKWGGGGVVLLRPKLGFARTTPSGSSGRRKGGQARRG